MEKVFDNPELFLSIDVSLWLCTIYRPGKDAGFRPLWWLALKRYGAHTTGAEPENPPAANSTLREVKRDSAKTIDSERTSLRLTSHPCY